MPRHYYEFSRASSRKFWEIDRSGSTVTVRFGRIGTTGTSKSKKFTSPEAAAAHMARLCGEKLKKGYRIARPSSNSLVRHPSVKAARAAAPRTKSEDATPAAEESTTLATPAGVPDYAWFAERKSARGTLVFGVWKKSLPRKGFEIWTASYREGDLNPKIVRHGSSVADPDEADQLAAKVFSAKLQSGYQMWRPAPTAARPPEQAASGSAGELGVIVNKLKAWLSTHGRVSAVFVRHPAVDRFDIGAPIIADREGDGANRTRRGAKTASGPIAVERSTYFGLSSRYAVSDTEQCESLLAGLAHGFDVDNVCISNESMQDCVEEEKWRIEETEYFATKSGRWMRMPASASRKFDGKSDGASPFAAALLVPADPVAESIKILTGRLSGSEAKELIIAIGSMPTSMAVAEVLANAMGAPIPRKARPRRGSIPELVWPRCNPRLRGLSEAAQYAN